MRHTPEKQGLNMNTYEGFAQEAEGGPAHFRLLKSDLLPFTMLIDYAQAMARIVSSAYGRDSGPSDDHQALYPLIKSTYPPLDL